METAMISGLDPTSFSSVITPNNDLFRYVNGPWIDTYRLPDDRSRFGSFDKLAEDAEQHIRDILEDEHCQATLSQTIYRSFCDTEAIEQAGLGPIEPTLRRIDDATDKAQLISILGALNPSGGPDLFDIAIYGDPDDPRINTVHIEQGGLILPDEAYYREDRYAPIRDQYVQMIVKLLMLSHSGDADECESLANRHLDLETRIASHHWDNVATRDSQKTHNPTSFEELSSSLPHLDILAWATAWQHAYDEASGTDDLPVDLIGALQHTIVHEPSFLRGLDTVWDQAQLDDLKLWAKVHTLVHWAGLLSHDFDETNFEFFGKVLSGATKQRDRWKRAVSLVNGICGEDVGREYVSRYFPASSKHRVEQLVGNLIEAYRLSITNSTWLGEQTKAKALEKLSKFTPKIGYTNHWRDYSALAVSEDASLVDNMRAASIYESGFQLSKAGKPVDKDEWLMNPQTVNAYYEPSMNVIVFPAAILQPPFFDPAAEDAANYGGIGAVIGHEIGHGFDDQGSQYDGDGLLSDWWTEEDKKNFKMLTSALIAQYDAFVPKQLAEKYADHPQQVPHVNGALTIGENIGDLSGVNIALKAYAFALDNAHGQTADGSDAAIATVLDHAPKIDGFTGLQRFFLSYAAIWRSKQRDELTEQYLQIDPHSPAECRTNGIVRNVDLFYTAFGVKPGDDMWLDPGQRVHIW